MERVLDLAAVGPGDIVFDIGCGDGRLLCAAANRGAPPPAPTVPSLSPTPMQMKRPEQVYSTKWYALAEKPP